MTRAHGGQNHLKEIEGIRSCLEGLGIPKVNIITELYNVRDEKGNFRYPEFFLGKYELAETHICLKLNHVLQVKKNKKSKKKSICFYSVDRSEADVFKLNGTKILGKDYFPPEQLPQAEAMEPGISNKLIPFDALPLNLQRGFMDRRVTEEEAKLYLKHFKVSVGELFKSYEVYNTLNFFTLYPGE